jgi:hypothetical protein
MKYATMILRPDGTFDFYSNLIELHESEEIEISYQYFQRQLKGCGGSLELKNGSKVYRKEILRSGT